MFNTNHSYFSKLLVYLFCDIRNTILSYDLEHFFFTAIIRYVLSVLSYDYQEQSVGQRWPQPLLQSPPPPAPCLG